MEKDTQEKKLSGSQKTGFVLLFIFALLTVGLSFLQIRNNIYNPFALNISQADADILQSLQYDENSKLQQIDTDQDGLNDYEEINFYGTSRYLPDTDSDKIGDKEEIDNGTNPLCPEGETCVQEQFATSSSTDINVSPLLDGMLTPDQILMGSQDQLNTQSLENASTTEDIGAYIDDPIVLREMLIATGKVTLEDLQGIDDNTLIQLAKELFSTQFQN
jgi:hypothetical protein